MPKVKVTADIPASLKTALDDEVAKTKTDESSIVTAALAQYLKTPIHTLFQVSTSGALVAGVYSGAVSVKSLLEHGDFGLGTFANLDGEMVVPRWACLSSSRYRPGLRSSGSSRGTFRGGDEVCARRRCEDRINHEFLRIAEAL
jgi:hypothetical protein